MDNDAPQSPADSSPSTESPQAAPRRSFLVSALAVIIGGVVSLFPVVVGAFVFLDPLRKRKSWAPEGEEPSIDPEGFIRVTGIEAIPEDGTPVLAKVIADRLDVWTYFRNEAIGAVYLRKSDDNTVTAFNVSCPHLGCAVDFNADDRGFFCPCHNSSFTLDGKHSENSPSARDLDDLLVDVRDGQVWVKYQNFRKIIAEKIPES